MPELVQQSAHPARVSFDVQERSNVTLSIDIDGVRVLILAFAWVQVAACQDRVDVAEADLAVRLGRELDDVTLGI